MLFSSCGPAHVLCAHLSRHIDSRPWLLQVWTYHSRAAFVLSVTEKGQPVLDGIKLQRLRQLLLQQIDDSQEGMINIKKVWGLPCAILACYLPSSAEAVLIVPHLKLSRGCAWTDLLRIGKPNA